MEDSIRGGYAYTAPSICWLHREASWPVFCARRGRPSALYRADEKLTAAPHRAAQSGEAVLRRCLAIRQGRTKSFTRSAFGGCLIGKLDPVIGRDDEIQRVGP